MTCSEKDCGRKVYAKGICAYHYRAALYGPQAARLADFWRRYKAERPACWQSLRAFVDAIGPMPGQGYRLRKLDLSRPFAPGNVGWVPRVPVAVRSCEDGPAYQRQLRFIRQYDLKPGEFEAMVERQGGKCAICKRPPSKRLGRAKGPLLVVDHHHGSNKVRSLLCGSCNVGLGAFEENPSFLASAIIYLAQHAEIEAGKQPSVQPDFRSQEH